MNAIDWLRETAKFMVADRPDVYDYETAVEELSVAMDALREADITPFSAVMFTSYALMRIYISGVEEFLLSRKLSSLLVFEEEEEVSAYAHLDGIDLQKPYDEPTDPLDDLTDL